MCWSAKSSIIAWWLSAIIALLLWYRNYTYDRIIAVTVFVLGLIQLINYGSHSAVDPVTSGKCIVLLLVTLLLVVVFSTYIYTHNTISMWLSVITMVLAVVMIFTIFWSGTNYLAIVDEMNNCPNWANGTDNILGSWIWVFIAILLTCWVIVMSYHGFNDLGLYLIGAYVILSGIWAAEGSNRLNFGPRWCYLLVGLGLVVWLTGLVGEFSDQD